MSDMADYCFDMAIQQEAEYQDRIDYWLAMDDETLKKETSKSRLPIINSIRKFEKLSGKQRIVLARWIVDRDEIDYYA